MYYGLNHLGLLQTSGCTTVEASQCLKMHEKRIWLLLAGCFSPHSPRGVPTSNTPWDGALRISVAQWFNSKEASPHRVLLFWGLPALPHTSSIFSLECGKKHHECFDQEKKCLEHDPKVLFGLCLTQRYPAEVTDLISEGEIGSGTCGQVFKVRFKKTGHVIAVKVRTLGTQPFTLHTYQPRNEALLVSW